MSPTQFAWNIVFPGRPYPPPEPRRPNIPRCATDAVCWLCAGPTQGVGWPRDLALPSTFASHNQARAQYSDAVCQPCAGFAVGATWHEHVQASNLGLKLWTAASWRNYGHLFHASGHRCPKPAEWREILLTPPEPPYLAIISLTGKKNLIFRGTITYTPAALNLLLEEERLTVRHSDLVACLREFESLLNMGFSRDAVLTGNYNGSAVLKIGLGKVQAADVGMKRWRETNGRLVELCHYIAGKESLD